MLGVLIMSKYKVGDELIVIESKDDEKRNLKEQCHLNLKDDYATLCWGIKVVKVEYEMPNVTLTYRNAKGEENKVFARCKDTQNFEEERVLEKALLKAFLNEMVALETFRDHNLLR